MMKNEREKLTSFVFFVVVVACSVLGRLLLEENKQQQQKFIIFNYLSVVQVLFCGLTKGISPKICMLCQNK